MKRLSLLVAIIAITSCQEEKNYCGPITEKYRTSGGYKTRSENHVVIFSDSLKRNIDVKVTDNCYVNAEKNDRVCFMLYDYQVE